MSGVLLDDQSGAILALATFDSWTKRIHLSEIEHYVLERKVCLHSKVRSLKVRRFPVPFRLRSQLEPIYAMVMAGHTYPCLTRTASHCLLQTQSPALYCSYFGRVHYLA